MSGAPNRFCTFCAQLRGAQGEPRGEQKVAQSQGSEGASLAESQEPEREDEVEQEDKQVRESKDEPGREETFFPFVFLSLYTIYLRKSTTARFV